jgi:hypothetical protein
LRFGTQPRHQFEFARGIGFLDLQVGESAPIS